MIAKAKVVLREQRSMARDGGHFYMRVAIALVTIPAHEGPTHILVITTNCTQTYPNARSFYGDEHETRTSTSSEVVESGDRENAAVLRRATVIADEAFASAPAWFDATLEREKAAVSP